jgi:ribosomal protein S27AE
MKDLMKKRVVPYDGNTATRAPNYPAGQAGDHCYHREGVSIMSRVKICPKCSSGDILRIPEKSSGDSAVGLSNWWPSNVWVTRYVCGACGYTEQWIESADDIRAIREKFAREGGT